MNISEKYPNISAEVAEQLQGIADNEPKIYAEGIEQGKQAERNAFWDTLQNYGKRNVYYNAFTSAHYANIWTDKIFNPKYEINCTGNIDGARSLFFSCVFLTDIKVPVNVEGVLVSQSFCYCERLKRIPLLKVNEQTTWMNSFLKCYELQELTIEGTIGQSGLDLKDSTKLTKASIESIIGNLDQTEGSPARSITLSLMAVNKAFEGGADGDEFTDVCASARALGNWTISLM